MKYNYEETFCNLYFPTGEVVAVLHGYRASNPISSGSSIHCTQTPSFVRGSLKC